MFCCVMTRHWSQERYAEDCSGQFPTSRTALHCKDHPNSKALMAQPSYVNVLRPMQYRFQQLEDMGRTAPRRRVSRTAAPAPAMVAIRRSLLSFIKAIVTDPGWDICRVNVGWSSLQVSDELEMRRRYKALVPDSAARLRFAFRHGLSGSISFHLTATV